MKIVWYDGRMESWRYKREMAGEEILASCLPINIDYPLFFAAYPRLYR